MKLCRWCNVRALLFRIGKYRQIAVLVVTGSETHWHDELAQASEVVYLKVGTMEPLPSVGFSIHSKAIDNAESTP